MSSAMLSNPLNSGKLGNLIKSAAFASTSAKIDTPERIGLAEESGSVSFGLSSVLPLRFEAILPTQL